MSIVPSERDKGRNEMFDELIPSLVQSNTALARLCAVLNLDGVLSEGQLSSIMDMDRIEVRKLIDDGRDMLRERPLTGVWGAGVMKRIAP